MTFITPEIRDELSILYTQPTRFYHSLTHVHSLLALLSTHRASFTDPDAVEAAIWFHDAIYDSRAKAPSNEVDSAALAVARLRGTTSPDRLERIRVMIDATATHTVPTVEQLRAPAGEGGGGDVVLDVVADAAMFLDMDLGILGAPEAEFDAYEAGVKREYAWVGEEGWRTGRADVLRRFLEREHIFYSPLFRGLLEGKARANLARSLARLQAVGSDKKDAAV